MGIAADPWLQHLQRHLPLAREGERIEGAHQLRVACGRLSVWLKLGDWRVLRPELGALRGAAAEVREIDLLLATKLDPGLSEFLAPRRVLAQDILVRALDAPQTPLLLRALAALPPTPARRARRGLDRLEDRLEAALKVARGRPEDAEAWHDVRRALRKVRYARDWLGLKGRGLGKLQEQLGAANDAHTALLWVRRWGQAPALEASLEARTSEALATAARALESR